MCSYFPLVATAFSWVIFQFRRFDNQLTNHTVSFTHPTGTIYPSVTSAAKGSEKVKTTSFRAPKQSSKVKKLYLVTSQHKGKHFHPGWFYATPKYISKSSLNPGEKNRKRHGDWLNQNQVNESQGATIMSIQLAGSFKKQGFGASPRHWQQ